MIEPDDVIAQQVADAAAGAGASVADVDAGPGAGASGAGLEAGAGDAPGAAAGEPVTITAYPDGPLLIRGTFEILTPTGEVIPPRRKTVALCRCGMSTLKPFCDGSHKAVGFKTEQEPPAPQPPLN